MDDFGRLTPAPKGGKGFLPLAQFCHALGLKFDIHIIRGIL
jgi:hypothetical protein